MIISINMKLAQPIPVNPTNAMIIEVICNLNKGKRKRRILNYQKITDGVMAANSVLKPRMLRSMRIDFDGARYVSSITNLPCSYKYEAYQSRFSLVLINRQWCLESVWTEAIRYRSEIPGEIILTELQQNAMPNKMDFVVVDIDSARLTQCFRNITLNAISDGIDSSLEMCG